MISFYEAEEKINNLAGKINPSIISLNLMDAIGCTLAEDIYTDIDMPPFNYSAMDGFAIKYSPDVSSWQYAGEITAGHFQNFNIDENQAISIMTGSKIPAAADTVIPIEHVEVKRNRINLINKPDGENLTGKNDIIIGKNVRYAAEDLALGEIAVKSGAILTHNNIAAAAACGKNIVKVLGKLKIAVFSTGDELIPISEKPTADKIRNTNLYTLISALKQIGMDPLNYGIIQDDKEYLNYKISEILNSGIDFLITTGGVSVGKHDYLPEIFENIDCERIFWKVNIKPGKPILFNVYKFKDRLIPVFSLPGNPVSCFVNFEIFIRPMINKIYRKEEYRIFSAILTKDLTKNDKKTHFKNGKFYYDRNSNRYLVECLLGNSSGDLISLGNSNCLVIIPENQSNIKAGENVECIRI